MISLAIVTTAAIKKEDFHLYYKRIISSLIPSEKKKKKPKIFVPKRLGILKPNQLLKTEMFDKELTLEDLEALKIRSSKDFTVSPDLFLFSLKKDDEWQPLPPTEDGIEHKLDWQFPDWETHLRIYGRQKIGFSYGWSHYLKKPKYVEATASSSAITRGFKPTQSLEIHIKGKVGKKVTIDIDSSGRQEHDTYKVEYNALRDDEFIQNITAGNIGVSIPGSSYAVGSSGGTKNAFGIKATAKKGKWKFQALASMTRGITEVKHFKGTSQLVVKNIKDYDYVKKKYYMLNNGSPIKTASQTIYIDDNNKNNNFGTVPIVTKISNAPETNDCDLLYSGTDYIIDYNKALLIFIRAIADTDDIIITYKQVDGSSTMYIDPLVSTNSDYAIVMTNAKDNKPYTFLYRKNTITPYEYKGVYYLGNQNIQKSGKDFRFFILDRDFHKLDKQPFSELNVESYNAGGYAYYLDEQKGYVIFNNSKPFEFTGSYYLSYPEKSIYGLNPNYSDSYYYLHLEYRYESRSFSLHWDIIPESEMVFLNGRKLTRNKDYTIDYKTGQLEFSSSVNINPDSEIDVVYEYLPFGGGLQEILAGARIDWDAADWLSLGTVGFYNGKQAPSRIPSPNNVSDSRWVGSVFGKATFDQKKTAYGMDAILPGRNRKFFRDKMPFTVSVGGEYAGSYHNINTFGQTMLDDFEGSIDTYSLSVKDNDWYLCAARDNSEWATRSELQYRDFHNYDEDERLEPLSWMANAFHPSYSVKAGPYNVNEGHLESGQLSNPDAGQRSLALEYDFTSGRTWAGIIRKDAFTGGGKDFREYTDLVMWVKLVDDDSLFNASVKMKVDIGVFNEDIDGDGAFDYETSKNSLGFVFNSQDHPQTVIGGGPKDPGNYIPANGVLDTEDLDKDGHLYNPPYEEAISWPASYALTETGLSILTVTESEGWRLVRISIKDQNALSSDQRDLIKQIKHIRVIVETNEGQKGYLLIDQMYFAGLSWRDRKLNDQAITASNANHFNAYIISTHDNEDYNNNSLRRNDEEDYDDRHGSLTSEEAEQENEQALAIQYDNLSKHNFNYTISSNYQLTGNYSAGYISRDFSQPIDLRYYKKIMFWAYVPPSSTPVGEYIFFRFGGVNSYYEYRQLINWTGWKRIEIDLRSAAFKGLKPRDNYHGLYTGASKFRVVNIPNLKLINHITIGVYGSETVNGASGVVWVNDVYLDDVEKLQDHAYTYNFNFNLLKHLNLTYNHSYKGKDFSSIGGLGTGRESTSDSISGTWTSITWMPFNGGWSCSVDTSDTDELYVPINEQGLTVNRSVNGGVNINLPSSPISKSLYPQYWPNINLNGSISVTSNRKPLTWLFDDEYRTYHFSDSYSYSWNGSMKVPIFDTLLKSSVNYQLGRSKNNSESQTFEYTENKTNKFGFDVSTNYNFSQTIAWNTGGSYATGDFNVTPRYNYSYTLTKTDPNTNAWDLNNRNRNFSTSLNVPKVLIKPSISYSLGYLESSFYYKGSRIETDFDNYDKDPNLYKNANFNQNYSLGVGTFNIDWLIFKNLTPSFSQNMTFSHNDVSVITNTLMGVFNEFSDPFLLKLPGNYLYIPYLNPHYKSFEFVRMYRGEDEYLASKTSLGIGNAFSTWLGLNFWDVSQWSLTYSLNQHTSRSYSSYSLSQSWSVSASSSLNLMNIFNFWIWRQKQGSYTKSSALSYGASFRKTNGFLQKQIQYTISPNFGFSYRWKADKAISWNLAYSYSTTRFNEHEDFFKIIEEDYDKDFRDQLEPDTEEYPDKDSYSWTFKTSYAFSTTLKEYWKPPLFFKRPIKLGYKLDHTLTLAYTRTTYDYGQDDSQRDHIHPKEMVGQVSLNHGWTINISKNIYGGGHEKVVYEMTREERGEPGEDNDDVEQIFSWELGLHLTIKF